MEIYNDTYCVYIHTNKINGKRYVGQTINGNNINKRWSNGLGYKTCTAFYRAIQKYGWDSFEHEIVASNLTKEEANNFEKLLIQKLKSNNREFGYNITIGGDGVAGVKHTKEWCEQHSKDIQGENNPMYGKKHTEETLQKISASRTGKCVGKDNPFYGKHHTQESIKKLLDSRSWYKPSMDSIMKTAEKNKKPIVQINKYTNEIIKIFPSTKDAAIELGLDRGSITKCCQHKRKTVGGYIWEYKKNVS